MTIALKPRSRRYTRFTAGTPIYRAVTLPVLCTRFSGVLAAVCLLAGAAAAQTCPTTNSTPNFTSGGSVFGRISTQWNAYFGSKVDVNNGVLCNPKIIGNDTFGSFTISSGLSNVAGTRNIGNQMLIRNGGSLFTQLWPITKTASYVVNSDAGIISDHGALLIAGAAGITFGIPNPAALTKGITYQFGSDGANGYTLTTVGGSALIYGCQGTGSTGTTSLTVSFNTDVTVVDTGTGYKCESTAASSEVPSNAALKALPVATGAVVTRSGFSAAGDGGRAVYTYGTASCTLNSGNGDNGWEVKPNSPATGCWTADLRAIKPTPKIWGAVGNGTTDECTSGAFQGALDGVAAAGVYTLYGDSGQYKFTACSPVVPIKTSLVGPYTRPGMATDGVYTGLPGSLILDPARVLQVNRGGAVRGWIIRSSTLTNPTSGDPLTLFQNLNTLVAAAAGTGVRLGDGSTVDSGGDAVVEQNLIIGFNQCVSSANNNHIQIKNNQEDCTYGNKVVDVGEYALIENNHHWPFRVYGPVAAKWEAYYFYSPAVTAVANSGGFCQFTISGTNLFQSGNVITATATSPAACNNNGARQTITGVSGQTVTTNTVFVAGVTSAGGTLHSVGVLSRQGVADWIDRNTLATSGCDLCIISHEVIFGWDTGILINSSDHVKVNGPILDNWNQAQLSSSIGIDLEGTTAGTEITAPQISSHGWAIRQNTNGGLTRGTHLTSPVFFGNINGSVQHNVAAFFITGGIWDATQTSTTVPIMALGTGTSGTNVLVLSSVNSLNLAIGATVAGSGVAVGSLITALFTYDTDAMIVLDQNLTGSPSAATITITGVGAYASNNRVKVLATSFTQFTVDGGAYFSNNAITWTVPVTGAVNDGTGKCKLTVTNHGLSNSHIAYVQGVGGASTCNGASRITVFDSNHVILDTSSFTGSYTSGGTLSVTDQAMRAVSVGAVYVSPPDSTQNHMRQDTTQAKALEGYFVGAPAPTQLLSSIRFSRPYWAHRNFGALPFFRSNVPCTASSVFSIVKNGNVIGTATIGAGGSVADIVSPAGQFDIQDQFDLYAPTVPDATCANFVWSLPVVP